MDLLCYGDANGMISFNSQGGTGNHQYSLQNSEFSFAPRFNQLVAGKYKVVVNDENHCGSYMEVELLQHEEVRVQIVRIGGSLSTPIDQWRIWNLEMIDCLC